MEDSTSRRAELYVRSLAPCGTRNEQDAIVERLLDLERRDILADVDLSVWGDAVCLDGASTQVGAGQRVADRIQEFYCWCEDRRVSLEPFFTWSDVDASMSNESFRRVVPPQRCLAVYVDDTLKDVYPSSLEGRHRSLKDGLRALEVVETRRTDQSQVFEGVGYTGD
jgi:hypothetical protein